MFSLFGLFSGQGRFLIVFQVGATFSEFFKSGGLLDDPGGHRHIGEGVPGYKRSDPAATRAQKRCIVMFVDKNITGYFSHITHIDDTLVYIPGTDPA